MKKGVIILCAMVLSCGLCAKAQNPFKDLTKNDVVVTYRVPNIVDFVTGYLSKTEDELRGSIAPEWQKYLKNEKLSKGVTFTVDKGNGYVRYDWVDKKSGEKTYVEFCYWSCTDNTHKLFAENIGGTKNDKPVFTEFTGLYIYAYDNATQKLYRIDQELLGLGEETRGEVTFSLPRVGKDIDMFVHNRSKVTQKKLTWNGKGFTLANKKVVPVKNK